ncbi:MAG: DUF521 domain-containing protein [Chloroflexi bacterium]|nr:MAG: DUF521 domain-containing protein [Chloroflexota bacterium]
MQLTSLQQEMLTGQHGHSTRKAMEILATLGEIYGAERMIPVSSAQIAGVSYDNLGEAGLHFLAEMAAGGGQARVLTTLNPAGMDVENWERMGISADFAAQQQRVIEAFARMGVVTTCSCTPYLTGNVPHYGEHIAWAESSAVCYANSVLGARTNREGGPSALAAALTGFTPAYGLHIAENRRPTVTMQVPARLAGTAEFGALGKLTGERLEQYGKERLPYITGIDLDRSPASLENLKSFCASIATYGGVAMFHMRGVTPEATLFPPPNEIITISREELDAALKEMSDAVPEEVDFVSLGCPHLSLAEIARIAQLLEGKKVKKTFWITTARPTKQMADMAGYTQTIEASGAIFAVDTCCVVAPIRGRFHALATDSAKACYYAAAKHKFKTLIRSFDEVVEEALR